MTSGLLNPQIYQTAQVDVDSDWDTASVKHKTFLITGGASGFGKGFFKALANLGATVIIGDISDGTALVEDTRKQTGNTNLHFLKLNVTSYDSQCQFFRQAKELSPRKTIDGVIANAGISERGRITESPACPENEDPPPPDMSTMDINFTGVTYTTYLAYHYFRQNTNLIPSSYPNATHDRSLLFIGSIASLTASPLLPLYSASKHGVLGLFRSLRYMSNGDKVRVNMLAPYFVATPMFSVTLGPLLLSGVDLAEEEDVVKAGVRCVADYKVAGRCLAVVPRVAGGVVDVVADDQSQIEVFVGRAVGLMNAKVAMDGWIHFIKAFILTFWSMLIGRVSK